VGAATAAVADRARAFVLSDAARSNPWLSSFVGALAAVVLGLLLTTALRSVIASELSSAMSQAATQAGSTGSATGTSALIGALGGAAVDRLLPNAGGMLLLAQGGSFHLGGQVASASVSGDLDISVRLPFTLLALLPVLALLFGGWTAARYSRATTVPESAVRGAMVAIPYSVMALAMCWLSASSSSVPIPAALLGGTSATVGVSAGVDWMSALFTSLLLGIIFGACGALIGARGSRALQDTTSAIRELRFPLAKPALAATRVIVIEAAAAGAFAVLWVVYALITRPQTPADVPTWFLLLPVLAVLAVAPTILAELVLLAHGIPMVAVASSVTASGSSGSTVSTGSTVSIWSLAAGSWGLSVLAVVVPLALLFMAGRGLSRHAGAKSVRDGLIEGLKLAIPYSAIVLMLAYFSQARVEVSGQILGLSGSLATGFFGASIWMTALVSLVLSGAAGAAGGASALLVPGRASTGLPQRTPVQVGVGSRPPEPRAFCPECGAANLLDSTFCEICGSRIPSHDKT